LELGFFYGYLGWEKVFVLIKKPGKVFPNFERPSDLAGAVFDPIDEGGGWKTVLAAKLREAGFHLRQTTAE
jgi:predicted nucleotide-binding protein